MSYHNLFHNTAPAKNMVSTTSVILVQYYNTLYILCMTKTECSDLTLK